MTSETRIINVEDLPSIEAPFTVLSDGERRKAQPLIGMIRREILARLGKEPQVIFRNERENLLMFSGRAEMPGSFFVENDIQFELWNQERVGDYHPLGKQDACYAFYTDRVIRRVNFNDFSKVTFENGDIQLRKTFRGMEDPKVTGTDNYEVGPEELKGVLEHIVTFNQPILRHEENILVAGATH